MSDGVPDSLPPGARLVDLQRYPIHDLGSPGAVSLVSRWRWELEEHGACSLRGFLTAEGTQALADEAAGMLARAYRRTFTANFLYQSEADPSLPAAHPARHFWTTSSLHLASDQFPAGSLLRSLYEWQALTDLVARIQGKSKLYRDADDFQALNIIALEDGGRTVFHHDQCECVVTLLLQAPEGGGEFVYAPGTRDDAGHIDVERVAKAIDGDAAVLKRLERGAGTLTLFRGSRSLHGVTPVSGARRRVSAILSYDERPDRTGRDEKNIRLYGPRVAKLLAERRAAS